MEIDIKSKRKTEVAPPPPQIIKSLDISDAPKPREIAPVKGSTNPIVIFILFVIGIVGGLVGLGFLVVPLLTRESNNVTESSIVEEVMETDSEISVWKEYNDYDGEETNCYWVINPSRRTVDYVAYYSPSEQGVLHTFRYYITSWGDFKKKHSSVRFYLDHKYREPYGLTNSTTILVGGPHNNETETYGYPVYTIMVPERNKTYAFINSPDGENTYLSYAVLTKLNRSNPIVNNIKF